MGGVVNSVGSLFGGGKKPKAPETPDPTKLVEAQAQANRINETNPFASSTYSQGEDGTWTRNISYNPALQGQIDSNLNSLYSTMDKGLNLGALPQYSSGLQGVGKAGTPTSTKALGGIQNSINPNEFDINTYFNKVYSPLSSLINEQYDREGVALDSKLAAQGLALGSDAYKNAQEIQGSNKNNAMTQAMAQAYAQALGASQNAFNQELQAGQFANSAQQQNFAQRYGIDQLSNQNRAMDYQIALANSNLQNQAAQQARNDALLEYQLPMQNLSYLTGLGGQFSGTPQIDTLGAYGLAQQSAQNQYAAQMNNYANQNAGLFGLLGNLGSAYIMS